MSVINKDTQQYCAFCARVINKDCDYCPHCGQRNDAYLGRDEKSMPLAIFMAVFIGLFTWLYTYKKDWWKFWCAILAVIVTGGTLAIPVWIWAILDTILKPESFYKDYPFG